MATSTEKSSGQQTVTEEFVFNDWRFRGTQSHIRKSICTCKSGGGNISRDESDICQLCRYEAELPDLTQLPEMIFADNSLCLRHEKTGAVLTFETLNALKSIKAGHDPAVKVKASQQWMDSRKHCPFVRNTIKKPYDWTFTPFYGGDISNFKAVELTEEEIDLERLKIREPILFYQELTLYEDELADNGCSQLSLKFRCMPSGFFALLRFYLRVDFVWTCIKDVRLYWRIDRPSYILREYRTRQKSWSELNEHERASVLNPAELWPTLNPVDEENRSEKLILF